MTTRLRRLLALLAVLALTGFAAACGDDDDDGGDQAADTTQTKQTGGKDPESTFLAFQSALADGDAEAVCGSLTPSAVKQAEEASIGGECDTWVEELSGAFDPASKAKLERTKVDKVEEKGDRATLEYTSPILNLPLEAELEKDGEVWKISKLAEGV